MTRVIGNDSVAAQVVIGNLQFAAYGRGLWGNNIRVQVAAGSAAGQNPALFKVSASHTIGISPTRSST
ncbi:MAG: hypothetical protein U0521_22600 [Anaerolineae bacterium]